MASMEKILASKICDHYGDGCHVFGSLLNNHIAGFEYPNWAHRTVQDAMNIMPAEAVVKMWHAFGFTNVTSSAFVPSHPLPQAALSELDSIAADLTAGMEADIWFDAAKFGDGDAQAVIERTQRAMYHAVNQLSAASKRIAALETLLLNTSYPLNSDSNNPGGYTLEATRSGVTGICDEFSVSVLNPKGDCVGDVLVGLTRGGEPRILLTTDGEGDGSHQVAVFPLRPASEAVVFDWDVPATTPASRQ